MPGEARTEQPSAYDPDTSLPDTHLMERKVNIGSCRDVVSLLRRRPQRGCAVRCHAPMLPIGRDVR